MIAALRRRAATWLELPPEPDVDTFLADGHRHTKIFHPSRGFYRYRILRWVLKQVGTLIGIIFGLLFLHQLPDFGFVEVLYFLEYLGIAAFVALQPITLFVLSLDYHQRWYVITDRSLMIREGLFTVRQQTMSYANIQNLAIRQGPLQRFFGIADLEVRTAGGGEASEARDEKSLRKNPHLGFFRGIDNAEELRELLLRRVQAVRDMPPEPTAEETPAEPPARDVTAAAEAALREARALRGALVQVQ